MLRGASSPPIASTAIQIIQGSRFKVRLVLFHRSDLPSAVVAAVGADAVRLLGLVAVRTLRQAGGFEGIVRAAIGRPRLGMSSFWIWHLPSPSSSSPACFPAS